MNNINKLNDNELENVAGGTLTLPPYSRRVFEL